MKIVELRFKNLNSLYGEWFIDFTHPDYTSNGIFALTGPTGAGKSTILDAICLALYGSTPRLGKINQSENEIMSRQTGECYAEVLFESQSGRFICYWGQCRARKSAEGKLQDYKHEIANADTGKLIENKKSLIGEVVEEKTGMDFDRFTRSILLAQGGFDTFLKANTEQKSKILEQITGTEIYSKISQSVHERQSAEREKLNIITAKTSGIVILDPEKEVELENNLKEQRKQESTLLNQLKEITDAITTLTTLRKQQSDDHDYLKKNCSALLELELPTSRQTAALKESEQLAIAAKKELRTTSPLINKIRLIDQKIAEQTKNISEAVYACAKDADKIEDNKKTMLKERTKLNTAKEKLEDATLYLKENAKDEWLIGGLAAVKEQLTNLLANQKEIIQMAADLEKADKATIKATEKLEKFSKQCYLKKQSMAAATERLQQSKNSLKTLLCNRLLREYRSEKETLLREMAFRRKIEELEAYRTKLEDGKLCPLCGSTEHPFAEGNIPMTDEIEEKIATLTEIIDKSDEQEAIIKKLEQAEITAQKNLNDSEKLEAEAVHEKKLAEKNLAETRENLRKYRTRFDEIKLTVYAKLKPLGIKEIFEKDVKTLLDHLELRKKRWQEQLTLKTTIENDIVTIDSEIKSYSAVIDIQINALTEKQKDLKQLKEDLYRITEERKQSYGDKKPDKEEERLIKAIDDAEKAEKQARTLHTTLQQKITEAKTRVASLKERIEQRAPELKKAETNFLSAIAKVEITDKKLDELEPQLKEFEDRIKSLRDTNAAITYTLKENRAAKEKIKEQYHAIEKQEKELRRWEALHALIGSADGKKYRNFAQGLTFELMVSIANKQLQSMTDRYLLIRDEQQPLELNVIDNYQAGEIRSTKNLSGGESFIVSLALALGLSKMSSKRVRVDSFFLDEGFGTLDDDSLEMALEALSGLQQEGKLIGIISHVSALKERISTQIKIVPISGGRSLISGPGCLKIVL